MTTTVAATNPMGSAFTTFTPRSLQISLGNELLRLAATHEGLAHQEASRLAYWEPCPRSVTGHREAARALRDDATRILSAVAR